MRLRLRLQPLAGALLMTACITLPLDAQDLTVTGMNYEQAEGGGPFTMYLRDGEMRMDQRNQSMILRFTGDDPGMLFIDHDDKEVSFLPSAAMAEAEGMVSARSAGAYETEPTPIPGLEVLAPVPETVTVIRNGTQEVMPVQGTRVGYHYEGNATLPGMEGAAMPPNMKDMMKIVLQMDSRAVVDPSIPGAEAAAAFYERALDSGLTSDQPAFASMTTGMMEVNQQIAQRGFPVWVGTVSKVDIQVSGPMAGMIQGMIQGIPGTDSTLSVAVIETVSTDQVDAELFYDGGFPPDYEVKVIEPPTASR